MRVRPSCKDPGEPSLRLAHDAAIAKEYLILLKCPAPARIRALAVSDPSFIARFPSAGMLVCLQDGMDVAGQI